MKTIGFWLHHSAITENETRLAKSQNSEMLGTSSLLETVGQWLSNTLISSSEPRVWQTRDRAGQATWHVYDPTTGHHEDFGSETEVRIWLERRYYQPLQEV